MPVRRATEADRLYLNVVTEDALDQMDAVLSDTDPVLPDIDALLAESDGNFEIVRQHLLTIINADMRTLFTKDGHVLPPVDWPDDMVPAIAKWSCNPRTGLWTFQLADKVRAAEQLARLENLYAKEEKANPLTKLLETIPREELKKVLVVLKSLGTEMNRDKEEENAGM